MLRRMTVYTVAFGLFVQFNNLSAEPSNTPIGILLAAGDIAECKPGNPKGQPADGFRQHLTADLLGKEISDANARGIRIRALALGDLAYKKKKSITDEFENCFHTSWGQHIKFILPVPGNHEYEFSKEALPYFDYFKKNDRKMVSENGATAGYYSLNFPDDGELPDRNIKPWRLIALR
jgi:hypothetical protein